MMKNKKEYMKPECTIVYFDENDIITTSVGLTDISTLDPDSANGDIPYGWLS